MLVRLRMWSERAMACGARWCGIVWSTDLPAAIRWQRSERLLTRRRPPVSSRGAGFVLRVISYLWGGQFMPKKKNKRSWAKRRPSPERGVFLALCDDPSCRPVDGLVLNVVPPLLRGGL